MKSTTVTCIAIVIIVVSSLAPTKAVAEEEKVTCDILQLQPCLPAAQTGSKPTTECCGKLKEQESCLCGYTKNPAYSPYFSADIAHRILEACAIPYPTC
ncbi:hypothetical protein EUTSA_v10009184mg [Eutrema salsugineum]|uniref:Bifunctional inhibitor/plant lipid transfer protein/seed storage helical domain-containing protein n=1 Tax=Eutrema salsugineum TaxID=72664 RepID=V4L1G3_EUTSA|nr:non-specific lipid-transfer protein 2 [Eutrema salsugineum]ESQ36127.1 hypothetical protein EUTSA_v10009184mg [Eutrema salsugineum]